MNKERLREHIESYKKVKSPDSIQFEEDFQERIGRVAYYQKHTPDRLKELSEEEFAEYISHLWAMLMWGNKQYVIDKLISQNGFEKIKEALTELLWGEEDIEHRWDKFRDNIKGMGPAMMSELLCMTHPREYMIWNRRALAGLKYLEVEDLPYYDYQCKGNKYKQLCDVAGEICDELKAAGYENADYLLVDYFIWDELQVEPVLDNINKTTTTRSKEEKVLPESEEEKSFIHDEVRDKLYDIGNWLGFNTYTEVKVAEGARVDTVWEAQIGNMGRVIYVFEVQTSGSIDSLLLNLLKSLNNPAVQGVVAVSDVNQLEKIKNQVESIQGLSRKLKTWDFQEVLEVHKALESVNEAINKLDLVPQGFYK